MKKTAVLLYPEFSEYELTVALSILMQGKKPIVTVGVNREIIRGESGLCCVADATIEEINLDELDSLLLPGCMDVMALANEEKLFDFIRRVATIDPLIASISSSPFLLAKAGVLKGKKYTIGMTEEDRKKTQVFAEENYSNELVVQDGKLITARGRGFISFGKYVGNALNLDFNDRWYYE